MSDDNRQDRPTALDLARMATQERRARAAGEQEARQARIQTAVTKTQELLDRFWPALGIDPTQYTFGRDDQLTWQGTITLGDPGSTHILATLVRVDERGLTISVNEKVICRNGHRLDNQHSLPTEPLSDSTVADVLLEGWLAARAHQKQLRDRILTSTNNEILCINDTNSTIEQMEARLEEYRTRIHNLPPNDYPEPMEQTVAFLENTLNEVAAKVAKRRANRDENIARRAKFVAAAEQIKSLAIHWQTEHAAYLAACRSLAETINRHHFTPFTVYKVRYTPIGASAVDYDDEERASLMIEEIWTLDDGTYVAKNSPGATLRAISANGTIYRTVIGAFLDATTAAEETQPPAADQKREFYQKVLVGESGFCMNFPPSMTQEAIDEVLDRISYPQPPKPFNQIVIDQLRIRLNHWNMQHAGAWANFDPNDISETHFTLDVAAGTAPDDDDREIPF